MTTKGMLEDIRVLDLTRVVSGPSCTRALADLGAQVIKIEPPEGDLWRLGVPKIDAISVSFAQLNAGKHFLSVDMSTEQGRALVFQLALQCDVLVENFRPGVAGRLGLGYQSIKAEKADIIYCSISGYGQDGPASQRRAYAPIIHAELGLLDQNAREWGTQPLPETASHVDFAVGMQASNGILAALHHRDNTGEGAHIDASMAETMLAMNEATAVEVNGGLGDALSPFRPGKAPILQVKDGNWAQLPGNPLTMVFSIARALGKESELTQLGWVDPTSMSIDDATNKLKAWAAEFADVKSLEQALDAIRIPVGEVGELAATADLDWALARSAFTDIDSGNETIKVPTSPLRISDHFVGPRTGVTVQGGDNVAVLKELLSLGAEQIQQLQDDGVLIGEDWSGDSRNPFG